jgi:hypothetical protein
MKKHILLAASYILIVSNLACAADDNFFPKRISREFSADLTGCLKKLPVNLGQQEKIKEVLAYSEYRKILLFVDSPLNRDRLIQASKLQNPFLLVETLDILSFNLGMESFSEWYFSRLVTYVNEKPAFYMLLFLRFCRKSDGEYAEWFADSLAEIIEKYPMEFSTTLESFNEVEKFCGILETGDDRQNSRSMKKLADYNKAARLKKVKGLLDCMNRLSNAKPSAGNTKR